MYKGMTKLAAALQYLIELLVENESPVSRLRLAKLLYLADWESFLGWNQRVAEVAWRFWFYGPWAQEVQQALRIPAKAATHSGRKRPGIPVESGHPLSRSDLSTVALAKVEATTRDRSLTVLCSRFRAG